MKNRAGFTLIELLVVVGIIGTLAGVLLPAIQAVREKARRTQCEKNLLQLGLALGNYASAHRVFPPGVVDLKGPIRSVPRGYHVGWIVQILPFLEQGNVYRHVDLRRGVYDPENATALCSRFALFLCPSNPNRSTMDYAGCHHDVEAPIDSNNHGVLYLNSRVGYDDITDGPAFTILAGETQTGASFGWAPGTRDTLRNTGLPINTPEPAPMVGSLLSVIPAMESDDTPSAIPGMEGEAMDDRSGSGLYPPGFVGGFSSWHRLGANFLFCDGSLHFLRQTIDPGVYRSLGHRSDGEIISGEQY